MDRRRAALRYGSYVASDPENDVNDTPDVSRATKRRRSTRTSSVSTASTTAAVPTRRRTRSSSVVASAAVSNGKEEEKKKKTPSSSKSKRTRRSKVEAEQAAEASDEPSPGSPGEDEQEVMPQEPVPGSTEKRASRKRRATQEVDGFRYKRGRMSMASMATAAIAAAAHAEADPEIVDEDDNAVQRQTEKTRDAQSKDAAKSSGAEGDDGDDDDDDDDDEMDEPHEMERVVEALERISEARLSHLAATTAVSRQFVPKHLKLILAGYLSDLKATAQEAKALQRSQEPEASASDALMYRNPANVKLVAKEAKLARLLETFKKEDSEWRQLKAAYTSTEDTRVAEVLSQPASSFASVDEDAVARVELMKAVQMSTRSASAQVDQITVACARLAASKDKASTVFTRLARDMREEAFAPLSGATATDARSLLRAASKESAA